MRRRSVCSPGREGWGWDPRGRETRGGFGEVTFVSSVPESRRGDPFSRLVSHRGRRCNTGRRGNSIRPPDGVSRRRTDVMLCFWRNLYQIMGRGGATDIRNVPVHRTGVSGPQARYPSRLTHKPLTGRRSRTKSKRGSRETQEPERLKRRSEGEKEGEAEWRDQRRRGTERGTEKGWNR